MTRTFGILFFILFSSLTLVAQKVVEGVIVDENNEPIPYSEIRVVEDTVETISNAEGRFSLIIPNEAQMIQVVSMGYESRTVAITGEFLTIVLKEIDYSDQDVVSTAHSSPISYWYGAKLSYNLLGNSEIQNFVASAPVKLGVWRDDEGGKLKLFLTGNLANFSVDQSDEDIRTENEIVQPDRGLSVAFSPTYLIRDSDTYQNEFRLYLFANIGYKYNNFKLTNSENKIGLSQFIFNGGIELEGFTLKNDSKPVQVSLKYFLTSFDQDEYFTLTGTRKTKLDGCSIGIVLPIPGLPMGFGASTIFRSNEEPIWTIGILIRN